MECKGTIVRASGISGNYQHLGEPANSGDFSRSFIALCQTEPRQVRCGPCQTECTGYNAQGSGILERWAASGNCRSRPFPFLRKHEPAGFTVALANVGAHNVEGKIRLSGFQNMARRRVAAEVCELRARGVLLLAHEGHGAVKPAEAFTRTMMRSQRTSASFSAVRFHASCGSKRNRFKIAASLIS